MLDCLQSNITRPHQVLLEVGYGNFFPVLESTTTTRALSGVGMARVKEEELLEVGYGNFLPASMRRQGAPRGAPL